MQVERSFIEELKFKFKYGGMHIKLLFVNSIVFLVIGISEVFGRLIGNEANFIIQHLARIIFTLKADFLGFIQQPWGLLTSIFAHFGFMHFLFNMIFLFFVGKMFEQIFGARRLLSTYLIGGFAGGVFEILAHHIFPAMSTQSSVIVGASGSIMAIFMALAFYRPNMTVMLFGVVPVRIIILGVLYLLYDVFNLGNNDGTAHFAHLGGAIIGIISIQNPFASTNFLFRFETFLYKFSSSIQSVFKKKSSANLKVKVGGRRKTDEEYVLEKKEKQAKIDKILDKIAKSGYESLSKAEKDFLFNESKK
jgi:membrane associated rhomboid family serine protease